MLFDKSALSLLAFSVVLAAATPLRRNMPASQCTTAPVQCCNSVQPSSSFAAQTVLDLIGVALNDPSVLVGITCTPISVVGAGAASCSQNTVCCEDNSFHNIASIGCVPVDMNA